MSTQRAADFFKAQAFTQSLRSMLESLPSEEDRRQMASDLDILIRFLAEMKERLVAIPSRDDAIGARSALERLDAWFASAKSNPVLATAIGIKRSASRPKPAPFGSEDIERAKATLAQLEPLPIDELRTKLDGMAPRELQSVASALGIRTTQRSGHETLAHQIATKITNARGYRSLRDGESQG